MTKWFCLGWYKYLFSNLDFAYDYRHKLQIILCRIKGHPNGIIYYTGASATEPDNRCKDCFEDIG